MTSDPLKPVDVGSLSSAVLVRKLHRDLELDGDEVIAADAPGSSRGNDTGHRLERWPAKCFTRFGEDLSGTLDGRGRGRRLGRSGSATGWWRSSLGGRLSAQNHGGDQGEGRKNRE